MLGVSGCHWALSWQASRPFVAKLGRFLWFDWFLISEDIDKIWDFIKSFWLNSIATITVCYFTIYKGTTKVSILKISELLTVNKNVKPWGGIIDSELPLLHSSPFYDNRLLRAERSRCMWDPLRGTRRLLYDCVWLVAVNQFSANPASPVPPRAAEVSLHLRKLLANCTWVFSSALYELCPSWLQITKAQILGLRTDHWVVLPLEVPSYIGKPNYLVQPGVMPGWAWG